MAIPPAPDTHVAYVALGSNLGDRAARLEAGRRALAQDTRIVVVAASSIFETAPIGPLPQPSYLNAVLELRTSRSPRSLLDRMLEIEVAQGRRRESDEPRWGARTLDLDLLLYDDEAIREPGLEVPHPRLHERAFVLVPLCELAADRIHPVLGGRFRDYALRSHDAEGVRVWSEAAGWRVGRCDG